MVGSNPELGLQQGKACHARGLTALLAVVGGSNLNGRHRLDLTALCKEEPENGP